MHVAIIMDGNGRWAQKRGLERSAGHRAGARVVRRIVEAAARDERVDMLTLYAFSSDNWSRPSAEVETLMRLFNRYLRSEVARAVENGVRIEIIGRRDRLGDSLVDLIEQTENMTAAGQRLTLRLAVDYSARDAILRAALATADDQPPESADRTQRAEWFAQRIAAATNAVDDGSCVDLLIRTGGEKRLSDFLLWECAYAELLFVDESWPDFDEQGFEAALGEFQRRTRRFGGLPDAVSG
jgi:undecaprenyl diphosphate synthase